MEMVLLGKLLLLDVIKLQLCFLAKGTWNLDDNGIGNSVINSTHGQFLKSIERNSAEIGCVIEPWRNRDWDWSRCTKIPSFVDLISKNTFLSFFWIWNCWKWRELYQVSGGPDFSLCGNKKSTCCLTRTVTFHNELTVGSKENQKILLRTITHCDY